MTDQIEELGEKVLEVLRRNDVKRTRGLEVPVLFELLQELHAERPHLVGHGIVLFGRRRSGPEPHLCSHLLVEVLVEGGPSPVLADAHDVHEEFEARALKAAGAPVVVDGGDERSIGGRFGRGERVILDHDFWLDTWMVNEGFEMISGGTRIRG